MRNLILIILSVLVLVGCANENGDGYSTFDSSICSDTNSLNSFEVDRCNVRGELVTKYCEGDNECSTSCQNIIDENLLELYDNNTSPTLMLIKMDVIVNNVTEFNLTYSGFEYKCYKRLPKCEDVSFYICEKQFN